VHEFVGYREASVEQEGAVVCTVAPPPRVAFLGLEIPRLYFGQALNSLDVRFWLVRERRKEHV
jgi:hypothetical protein